jgi:transglutaminase-like putative cysteine protease
MPPLLGRADMKCRSIRLTTWTVCLVLVLAAIESPLAQPPWLKDAVLRGASVEVDKDASLLVLHHHTVTKIVASGNMVSDVRWAARILDKTGADMTDLTEAVNPLRKVKNLKGWLLRADGSKKELSKESIAEIDLDQAAGYYDDARSLVTGFSDLKPGDVVAYEYSVEQKDLMTAYYTAFVFQLAEPVVWACLEITTPPGWQIETATQQLDPVKYESQTDRHVWTAENLPYRPYEPFMPSWSLLARSVMISCHDGRAEAGRGYSSWKAAAAWTRDIQLAGCVDTVPLVATVAQLCGGLTSPAAKLEAIARFVRDEIRYVAIEIGLGRFQPRPAGTTLRNKYGDCKDKAALMRAMLSLVGIPSEAVSASIKDRVIPGFPSPLQFDHVIVAIPVAAVADLPSYPEATVDGWLYFDPTNEAVSLGKTGSSLRGTYVLKTSVDDTDLTRLPSLTPEDQRRRYRAYAELGADLKMRAEVTVIDYGVWAAEFGHTRSVTPVKDMIESWQKRFAYVVQNPTLTNYAIGSDADSSWVTFTLEASRAATESGPYCLLNTDFFHDDQADDLTEPKRVHPITFGDPAEVVTEIEWRLPAGWSPGGTPELISDSCQLASVNCEVAHGDRVNLTSKVRYFGGEIGPDGYESARRFNKSLRASQRVRTFLNKTGN